MLDARVNLGLTLVWSHTRGAEVTLQVIFGLTSTPLGKWVKFGWQVLIKILHNHPHSRIALPHPDDILVYKEAVSRRHRHLQDVAFAADGVNLFIEACRDELDHKNAFYKWMAT